MEKISSLSKLHDFFKKINFKLEDGKKDVWSKEYKNHANYYIKIKINLEHINKSIIDYGNKIKIGRKTTSTFFQDESLVILECVNRLLEKGYSPNSIYLEPKWSLGHKEKGFLDIIVFDKNKESSFLMIECKKNIKELEKERQKTIKDGGQIFSYYIQQPETKYLCLYSSELGEKEIIYNNHIVKVQDSFRDKGQQDIHEEWDKLFEENGIFEDNITPYNVEFCGIKKENLTELNENDGRFIFNRFAEILRKNVISDKTNAFNKIFNLFLCKIVDEDSKKDSEELDFQWREDEDNKIVMLRLNDLYKRGMKEYLKINISDYSESDIDSLLAKGNKESLQKMKDIIIELRLYTNNEFAFKEVFDKDTFDDNCIVVKEVVKLLEKYRLKYTTKQQFLGDFFEKLLNTGIKQEAGQFFTPTPLSRFVCKSIPISNIIDRKNENKEIDFLPHIIDFASGSGHFLTEIMGEVNNSILKINPNDIRGGKRAIDNFESIKNNYIWAKNYVYGIEKDYRLAKTSKVSCFLNGDGDANIICADGLDSFHKSKDYMGLLKTSDISKDNERFDILISNPPYSINGFKNTLKHGNESFDLFDDLTNNSSEIECLFIERATQLVKAGGYVGIVLPTSLLDNNNGLYPSTRKMIISNFEIYGIVELRDNAFMETGKNTSIFFMKKRKKDFLNKAKSTINNFLKEKNDLSFNSNEDIFSKYLSYAWEDINIEDYISIFSDNPSEKIKTSQKYEDYLEDNKKITHEKIISIEKEKLLFFLLSYNQKIVLVKSGEKKEEKRFLGYEFSRRRGYEGIKIYLDNKGEIETKLFDGGDLLNKDKINSYILRNFLGEEIDEISEELKDNLKISDLHDIIDFADSSDSLFMSTSKKKLIESKFDKVRIKKLVKDEKIIVGTGTNAPQEPKYYVNGKYPFIKADNLNYVDNEGFIIPNKESFVNDLAKEKFNFKEVEESTILFPKSGQSINTDNIGITKEKSFIVNHLAFISSKDKEFIKYLFYLLRDYGVSNLQSMSEGYPSINLNKDLYKFEIPLPNDTIIKNIIKDNQKIENEKKPLLDEISLLNNKLKDMVTKSDGTEKPLIRILVDIEDKINKIQAREYRKNGEIPIVSQGADFISGYTDEEIEPIKKSLPVIVFGDHNKTVKYIDFPFICGADGVKILKPNKEVHPKIFYYLIKYLNIWGDARYSRHYKYLIKAKIKIPEEQEELLNKIEIIEEQIKEAKFKISKLDGETKNILTKYLN